MEAVSNKVQLDRVLYAQARARGASRAQAAREAGSKAKAVDGLSKAGGRLEDEQEVQDLIADCRRDLLHAMEDDFEVARARARQVLEEDGAFKLWPKAWDFMAKVAGKFVTRHEHSGPEGGPMTFAEWMAEGDDE